MASRDGVGLLLDFFSLPIAVNLLIGSVLGASLGYLSRDWQARKEARARREILLQVLRDEVTSFVSYPGAANPSPTLPFGWFLDAKLFYFPIRTTALARLPDVLNYKEHGSLIRTALALQLAIARYNDCCQTLNQGRLVTHDPNAFADEGRRVGELLNRVLLTRDTVLSLLPAASKSGAEPASSMAATLLAWVRRPRPRG